jgi:hypothetical protein
MVQDLYLGISEHRLLTTFTLLAGNKPLKESKGRFNISIDALYQCVTLIQNF